ncbi:hypothetical protein [Winogradskyella flava]|uniref:hypothetical protein n=1 Tax=Winogradskyella flava TaxID=1884876 RepID=UPI002490D305|nr:hypothetical protein [Winogradskyella flava]
MKKLLLTLCSFALIISCSTSRQIEKAVNTGNYDVAMSNAINKLRTNKNTKRKAQFTVMLQEAYHKANQRDLENIKFLKTTNNPENLIKIYDLYVNVDNRQERVKPLLPLYVDGREVSFSMKNYANDIANAIDKASSHMYNNAIALLNSNSNNKLDYRLAYDQLNEIESINPNYKDVRQLTEVAYQKGVDFVLVEMTNDTQKVIPTQLETDLLNFSTYGLNNLWAVYHNNADNKVTYDYKMQVNLREINISPEQVQERQIIKEKEIKDGKKLLLDDQGNKVKDSLGNAIEVDNLKTIRCEYYEFKQFKAAQVTGNVEYYDLNTQQLADAFPVSSEFVFEHIYANANGDRRALENSLLAFLDRRAVPFPTEEQMIYDSGENLKAQIKTIVNSYVMR